MPGQGEELGSGQHARRDLRGARMRQVQGDLALRQAVVLQPLADQLRKIGELEFMHVHVVAFGARARRPWPNR